MQVLDPTAVDYAIEAHITLYSTADANLALAQAQAAAQTYKNKLQGALGRDIIRDELIAALKVYGVYSVGLVGTDVELADHEWARCTNIDVSVSGIKKG